MRFCSFSCDFHVMRLIEVRLCVDSHGTKRSHNNNNKFYDVPILYQEKFNAMRSDIDHTSVRAFKSMIPDDTMLPCNYSYEDIRLIRNSSTGRKPGLSLSLTRPFLHSVDFFHELNTNANITPCGITLHESDRY